MSWADDKAALKATVHATFALPIVYTRVVGGVPGVVTSLTARFNGDIRLLGGLSSVGYAQMVQQVPVLRIDKNDLLGGDPRVGDLILIPSEYLNLRVNNIQAMDQIYHIIEVEPYDGN